MDSITACPAWHRPAALVVALLLSACGGDTDRPRQLELNGAAMGTTWSVQVLDLPAGDDRAALRDDVEAAIVRAEQMLSTYIPGSDLMRFNRSGRTDWVDVSDELCSIVDTALTLSEMTGGAFDITVGPLVNLWGFGPDGNVTEPPAEDLIERVGAHTGYRKLEADCGRPALRKASADVYVDLSAFAKGYTVDKVAHILDAREVANYLVEIGGELRGRGLNASGREWAIAIEEPRLEGRSVQTIVGLSDRGMATSGDYRNFFEFDGRLYSHTIDPRTHWPISHAGASVTVVSESAGFADAMATALLVLGPEDGIEFADRHEIAAYFLVRTDAGLAERRSAQFEREVSIL